MKETAAVTMGLDDPLNFRTTLPPRTEVIPPVTHR